LAKSEFGDDYEKTTVLGVKDIEIFSPGKQGARSAYLIVINGKSVGKMFKLSSDTVVVGRAPTNEILIDDEGVSRKHAYIERPPPASSSSTARSSPPARSSRPRTACS